MKIRVLKGCAVNHMLSFPSFLGLLIQCMMKLHRERPQFMFFNITACCEKQHCTFWAYNGCSTSLRPCLYFTTLLRCLQSSLQTIHIYQKSRCSRLNLPQVGSSLQSPPFHSLPSLKQSPSVIIRTIKREGSRRISLWQCTAANWATASLSHSPLAQTSRYPQSPLIIQHRPFCSKSIDGGFQVF